MRRRMNTPALAVLSCLSLAFTQSFVSRTFLAGRSSFPSLVQSRLDRIVSQTRASAVASPSKTSIDERLIGAWRYVGGAYEIRESNGKVSFHEHVSGELTVQGEWLVAELPTAGTIRLQLSEDGNEVLSNFMVAGTGKWGEVITAVREWESLQARAKSLANQLKTYKFIGVEEGVTVTVDGRQRPIGLKLSPEAAAAGDLATRIVIAQGIARDESLSVMSEKLRENYADHFGGKAPGAAHIGGKAPGVA